MANRHRWASLTKILVPLILIRYFMKLGPLTAIIVHLKLRHVQVSVGLTFAADKTRPDHYGPS